MVKSRYSNFKKAILLVVFPSIFLSGCAPAFRANPFLRERIQNTGTIAVMPLEVEVYKVSAGGVQELVDEFSEEAKNNIKSALEDQFYGTRDYQIKYFPIPGNIEDPATKQLLKDTIALFKAVDFSIILHTYDASKQNIFPDKIKKFDYSLGQQVYPLSQHIKADLLLFVRGGDYVSTGGRVALMVWAALMGFTPMSAGPPHLSAALVEPKTGDVLWHNFLCPPSGYNFRNRQSVKKFMDILLKHFPKK